MSSIFYGWQTLNEPQGTVLQQITGYGLKPQGLLIVNSAWCRAHTRDSLKESLNTILYTHHILLILIFFFQFSFLYKICWCISNKRPIVYFLDCNRNKISMLTMDFPRTRLTFMYSSTYNIQSGITNRPVFFCLFVFFSVKITQLWLKPQFYNMETMQFSLNIFNLQNKNSIKT